MSPTWEKVSDGVWFRLSDDESAEQLVRLRLEAAIIGPGSGDDDDRWLVTAIDLPDTLVETVLEAPTANASVLKDVVDDEAGAVTEAAAG